MNQLTDKQKKILVIVAAVFIGSYIVRYVVNFVANAAYSYQARAAQEAKAEPKPQPPPPPTTPPPMPTTTPIKEPVPPVPAAAEPNTAVAEAGGAPASPPTPPPLPPAPSVAVPASFGILSGQWTGRTSIKARGKCIVTIELNENLPGRFSGFSRILCYPDATLGPQDRVARAMSPTNPQAAIFSGGMESDAFRLRVEKNIASDFSGCSFTGIDLSNFGARQLAATWTEASPCTGGTVILQKVR